MDQEVQVGWFVGRWEAGQNLFEAFSDEFDVERRFGFIMWNLVAGAGFEPAAFRL